MGCKFCKKFDFTSVAVKDNAICMAGGSGRFTDDHYRSRPEYQLFNYCPICGANLCYYQDATNTTRTTVVVALDDTGNRIPFAVEPTDVVLSEEAYYTISDLRVDMGCSFQLAKKAYEYAKENGGGYNEMIGACKAFMYCQNFKESAELFHKLMGEK